MYKGSSKYISSIISVAAHFSVTGNAYFIPMEWSDKPSRNEKFEKVEIKIAKKELVRHK